MSFIQHRKELKEKESKLRTCLTVYGNRMKATCKTIFMSIKTKCIQSGYQKFVVTAKSSEWKAHKTVFKTRSIKHIKNTTKNSKCIEYVWFGLDRKANQPPT